MEADLLPREDPQRISDTIPTISHTALRVAFDMAVLESIVIVARALFAFYLLISIAHILVLPNPIGYIMAGLATSTAFIFLGIYLYLPRYQFPLPWAQCFAVLSTGLVLINCLVHLWLQPNPQQTTNLMLYVIGLGCFLLSTKWLITAYAVTFLAWLMIVSQSASNPEWQHFGFALVQSMTLSALLYRIRVNYLTRLETLRIRDTLRKKELEIALINTEEARSAAEASRQGLEVALKKIQLNETRIRAVIDNMLSGLIIITPEGVIERVNPAAAQIFGNSPKYLEGRLIRDIFVNKDSIKDLWENLSKMALGHITEWEGYKDDGTIFPFEFSLYEINTPEGIRFAGEIRDVSERKEVDRLKGEFIATISHELRTPLTSIRGSLSLLASGMMGQLSDEAKEMVNIGERNSIRLISLINDILDLERLEKGRLDMHFEAVPVANIITRALEAARSYADQEHIQLRSKPCQTVIWGDEARLSQVLINLLSNAIKFSNPHSEVNIVIEEFSDRVKVTVADQGRGIPHIHLDKIFERFKQVEASDSRQKGGTGLGLAICKHIIEQHNGIIGVESLEGQGSQFWITLPKPEERLINS